MRYVAKGGGRNKPELAFSGAEAGKLSQYFPPRCGADPAPRELRKLPLRLCPHEVAVELFRGNPGRSRSAERVEDKVAFCRGGQDGATDEAQRLLGGVTTVELLPPWHRRDAPDGRDLGRWVPAVYEVVVEGVARRFALARP